MKIKFDHSFSKQELWDAVWGSDGSGITYWASEVDFIQGNFRTPCDFRITFLNPENDKLSTRKVSLVSLVKGYKKALEGNYKHCFGHSLDLSNSDACFGDVVIQCALFGKVVYN